MAKDFRHYCRLQSPHPGEVWMWGGVGGVRIFNLLTQEPAKSHKGRLGNAKLSSVDHSLKELAERIVSENIQSLAIPKLATGYGGLEWEDVLPLIKKRLGKVKIPIYIYSLFEKGKKAEEAEEKAKSA